MPAKLERSPRKGSFRLKRRSACKDQRIACCRVVNPAPGEGGRYVYGIVRSKGAMNFGSIGIGGAGEQVYTVNYLDIAAVVSKTGVAIYDPTRENALAHEHVIETVMKNHTIIPMSFGTVFRTDDDIREVLKGIYSSVKDVLEQMAGKLEFGLKVNWDRDQIIQELMEQDEEIRRFHREIIRKQLQSTYFARMQLGRMIDKALADRAIQVRPRNLRSAAHLLRGFAGQSAHRR